MDELPSPWLTIRLLLLIFNDESSFPFEGVDMARGPSLVFRLNFAVKSSSVSIFDFELKL